MTRALTYFLNEAVESLMRSWRSASLAILTIAAGLFVLGFFLMVNANLQRVVGRWSEAAELSVYLKDEATREQVQALQTLIDQAGLADGRQYLSKNDALSRFKEDFPDLAGATERLERNPLPASIEVRLERESPGDAVGNGGARRPARLGAGCCGRALRPPLAESTGLRGPIRAHHRAGDRRAAGGRRGVDSGQRRSPRGVCAA